MSALTSVIPLSLPMITRRVRAYFAPVNRITGVPAIFDPVVNAEWQLNSPPAPWIDLGWVSAFSRGSESKIVEVDTGSPATVQVQSRQKTGATISFRFDSWTKLSMALSASSQHTNLLTSTASVNGLGGSVVPATTLQKGTTANTLYLGTLDSTRFNVGDLIVIDDDYSTQTGFVGAAVAGSWVSDAASICNDIDYIRRISFNIGQIVAVGQDGGLQLSAPLIAGPPSSAMKLQQIVGFSDREGGSFFQEWSALFVLQGVQGERLFHYYPRLQPCQSASEVSVAISPLLNHILPDARFRALPIADPHDNIQTVYYRTFIPAPSGRI